MTEPRIIFVGNGAVLIAEMLEALKAALEDVAPEMSGSVFLQINAAIAKAERQP